MNTKFLPWRAFASALLRVGRDGLTGLWDRAAFAALAEKHLRRSGKEGLLLLVADIDGFKRINDTLGHPFGDMLLKQAAAVFAAVPYAAAGRLGGDEFGLLLPASKAIGLHTVCGRIRKDMDKLGLSVSIGTACSRRGQKDFYSLYLRADQMLYAEKEHRIFI